MTSIRHKKVFEDQFNIGGNLKYVHPSKQEAVKEILKVIPESLEELWLFGSSISGSCKETSDIDICLVGNTTHDEEKLIYMAPKCAVDIIKETPEGFLEEQTYKGSIYKQVQDTGVLIYKKGVGIIDD
ncbi:MAG TPA: nucleotidyltransferase domain-containing protein [Anaerovoracaceae bacterium]|nr:nucleotidyltransferase domain-containing protein [Anaerovoracaceae bacterium]